MVFTSLLSPSATLPNTSATGCKDVEVIFARGSGEKLGSENFTTWKTELTKQFQARTTLTYDFYELGTNSYGHSSYPAVAIGLDDGVSSLITTISATLTSIRLGEFNRSVDQGVAELVGRINSVSSSCANTKFVIGGYSQGALVVDRAIRKIDPQKIAHVATFGDPNLYLPEGEGINPPACQGKNLSPYRLYAPNCRAHSGILGTSKPYEPTGYANKVSLWCTKKDIMCSNYVDFENLLGDHTSYSSAGIFASAAKTIVDRVSTFFPDKQLIKSTFSPIKRETAILIDTTGSMSSIIEKYKKEALKLAKTTLEEGGEIALFEYRDLNDPFDTRKILDFGCNYQEFEAAINSLEVDGGDDILESALSGSLFTMNQLKWRTGATKSIVLLTDAPYLNPDRDGTTLKDVAEHSLEIDPVNFYVVVPEEIREDYEELANLTNGRVFTLSDDISLSTDYLLSRPEINLALEEYTGKPNDEFTFTATVGTLSPDDQLVYDWDLDFDGEFEVTNAASSINHIYQKESSGFVQVRATNQAGISSSASAKVIVTNDIESEPSLKILDLDNNVVSFTTSDNTLATLITVDGIPLGITHDHEISIDELDEDLGDGFSLTLIPLTKSGLRGESATLKLASGGLGETTLSRLNKRGPEKTTSPESDQPISTSPTNIKAPRAGVH